MAKKAIVILIIFLLLITIGILGYWGYQQGYFDQYLEKYDQTQEDSELTEQENQEDSQEQTSEEPEDENVEENQEVIEENDEVEEAEDSDDRILLNEKNSVDVNKELLCSIRFNSQEANEQVVYEGHGVSFNVPYNENWGTTKYAIEPYYEYDSSISFGNIFSFEACAWVREYNMKVQDSRTLSEILSDINENNNGEISNVESEKIGEIEIVSWISSSMCENVYYEVVGGSYNYVFNTTCSSDIDTDRLVIEKIIRSIRFLGKMLG